MLGSTIKEKTSIIQRGTPVVIQQALFPNLPGLGVLQLGNRAVEKGNGSTGLVVFSHPVHRLVDTIGSCVHKTLAQRRLKRK